jgi:hypothetical protein
MFCKMPIMGGLLVGKGIVEYVEGINEKQKLLYL